MDSACRPNSAFGLVASSTNVRRNIIGRDSGFAYAKDLAVNKEEVGY